MENIAFCVFDSAMTERHVHFNKCAFKFRLIFKWWDEAVIAVVRW